jgi:hypothetical protein
MEMYMDYMVINKVIYANFINNNSPILIYY